MIRLSLYINCTYTWLIACLHTQNKKLLTFIKFTASLFTLKFVPTKEQLIHHHLVISNFGKPARYVELLYNQNINRRGISNYSPHKSVRHAFFWFCFPQKKKIHWFFSKYIYRARFI